MTKSEVSELVAVLMACFPGVRFPSGTVAAYELFLQELELERAREAVKHLVKTCKFMPTIAEIIAAYEALAQRGPRRIRAWTPNPSPGDYRPTELAGAPIARMLEKKR